MFAVDFLIVTSVISADRSIRTCKMAELIFVTKHFRFSVDVAVTLYVNCRHGTAVQRDHV